MNKVLTTVFTAACMFAANVANAGDFRNHWGVDIEKDDMTDEVNVTVVKTANQRPVWFNRHNSIAIRCDDGVLEIFVVFPGKIMDTNVTNTRIRFDKDEPQLIDVGRSSDGTAYFLRWDKEFIRNLRKGNRLVVEYQPYDERAQTVTFLLGGMTKHLNLVGKYCPEAKG